MHKGLFYILFMSATALLSPTVYAQEAPGAYQACIACHGSAGEGNTALQSPALAGQSSAYLARQLRNFQSGVRGAEAGDTLGAQMRGMAASLGEEDIEAVSAWLAAQPRPAIDQPHSGDLKNGKDYYHSKCDACHGGAGEGNEVLNAPGFAWLDAAYVKRQFENFQKGLRGAHPQDKYGRQMKMMSDVLPEPGTIDDIIAYVQAMEASGDAAQ